MRARPLAKNAWFRAVKMRMSAARARGSEGWIVDGIPLDMRFFGSLCVCDLPLKRRTCIDSPRIQIGPEVRRIDGWVRRK